MTPEAWHVSRPAREVGLALWLAGVFGCGATLCIDAACLGAEPPSRPAPGTGRGPAGALEAPPQGKGEGYSKLKDGTVRIWDANQKYTMKHYDMRAWKDRATWSQVPHGVTAHPFRGDCIVEGGNFWLSLHSSPHDSVFLYAKTDANAAPGRHNELYRVFDTPNGRRNYGSGSQSCRILKNAPGEVVVHSEAITYERGGFETTVTTTYRVVGGKPWLEIRPVQQADEQGMHGESRFVLAPEAGADGRDFVEDSLKRPGDQLCRVPNRAKMLLDLVMDDETIWLLTAGEVAEGTRLGWPGTRFYAGNAPGGWHAGWSRVGEGDCSRVWTAPFALFAGKPVFVGVLRIGYWHYQKIGAKVQAGRPFHGKWTVAYERQITSSPFKPGGAWHPMYAGKWRMVGCVDGKYHVTEVVVRPKDLPPSAPRPVTEQTVGQSDFTFTSPEDGTLECVLFYLYGRTDDTPKDVWAPTDIYREVTAE